MKESFVFFETWAEALKQMPDKERLQLYDAISDYGIYGTKTELGGLAQMALNLVYNDIDETKAKRRERAEKNRKNINKRWHNSDTNESQKIQSNTIEYNRIQTIQVDTKHSVDGDVDVDVYGDVNVDSIKSIDSIESVEKSKIVADKSATRKQPAKTLEERQNDFMWKIAEVGKGVYPDEMLRAFFDYWSEHNENGKKMLFEMKKTFDIKKRLATWASRENDNQFKHTSNGNRNNPNSADYVSTERIVAAGLAMANANR